MSSFILETKLRKCKSTGALDVLNIYCAKCEKCIGSDCHNSSAGELLENLIKSQKEEVSLLKQKIGMLKDKFLQQQIKLRMIRSDFKMSHSLKNNLGDLLAESQKTLEEMVLSTTEVDNFESAITNCNLLPTLNPQNLETVKTEMKEALSELSEFLHSDELRDCIVTKATETVSSVIDSCLLETYPEPYLPIAEINNWAKWINIQESDGQLLKTVNTTPPLDAPPENHLDTLASSTLKLEESGFLSQSIEYLESTSPSDHAKNLLATNQSKPLQTDEEMRDALSKLSKCLKSLELKNRLATSAAEAVSNAIHNCLLETFPVPYTPMEEISKNTKTLKCPSKMANNLSNGSARLQKSIKKASQPVKEKPGYNHHKPMDSSAENVQGKVKNSPEMLPKVLMVPAQADFLYEDADDPYEDIQKVPPSPPQPTGPDVSLIDHLMQSAVINKQIEEGEFNKTFKEVLSYCNLSLVMVACRAADPAKVFNPCSLSQSVLLSLVQQLATDMVHETQLKCRYLEEALINLDVSDLVTQTYMPLVVGEVRSHLSKFVRSYPNHVASRRIALIIMAADNLMK